MGRTRVYETNQTTGETIMAKRKKDPIYDPSAQVYLTGISGERMSASNPGSKYRELSVSIGTIDNPQSGRSFIDSRMENHDQVGWPTITHILGEGHILKARGVLRKNFERDEIYLDADELHDLELVEPEPAGDEPTEITFGNGLVTMIK